MMTTSGQAGALIAGRYRLERPTGGGTWPEEIWQGFDETLNRPVMMRLLPLDGAVEPDLDEQVQSVVAQVARLGHPNIAQVYDVGHEGGLRYVVSEWTGGRTLGQIMATGRQRWQRAVDWGQQVAEALAALHAVGLVDGVLGPETVSVLDDRRVKLTDVGLGAPPDMATGSFRTAADQPTQLFDPYRQAPDAGAGGYGGDAEATQMMPPEGFGQGPGGEPTQMMPQYGDHSGGGLGAGGRGGRGALPAGSSADVYALGAILWTAIVGMPPQVGPSDTNGPDLTPLRDVDAPADFGRLLQSMLAASAPLRPTANVVANRFAALALEARESRSDTLPTAIVGQSTQGLGEPTRVAQARAAAVEDEPERSSGRTAGIVIGVIVLLAAAGVAVGLLLSSNSNNNPSPLTSTSGSVSTPSAGQVSVSAAPSSSAAATTTSAAPSTSSAPPSTSAAPSTSSAPPSTSAAPSTTSAPTTASPSTAATTTAAASSSTSKAAGAPGQQ